MILWVMLILGLLSLVMSLYCFKWHNDLNKELDKNPRKVEYAGYLISAYGVFLLFPVSLFIIGGSAYCLLAK